MSALEEVSKRKQQASHQQSLASDPSASVWVAASAGTGKTKVLTDRVLALLLKGVTADRILCLTFTKAAAAEMNNRLIERLQAWTNIEDQAVDSAILELLQAPPDRAQRERARRLFAEVLDTPGGIKIQTIHAFCQSLLARFPVEAGIVPNFSVLDDRGAKEALASARDLALAEAGLPGGETLQEDFTLVAQHANEQQFDEVLKALVSERGRLTELKASYQGLDALIGAIYQKLGVAPGADPNEILHLACQDRAFDGQALLTVVGVLRDSTKTDKEAADKIANWLTAAEDDRPSLFNSYKSIFYDSKKKLKPKLMAKKFYDEGHPIVETLAQEQARIENLQRKMNAATVAACSKALLKICDRILTHYDRHKTRRALLDYDDMILKTRELLAGEGRSTWVLFKLDGGLDHLLIDEAQDTNPDQWKVVELLAQDFFSGEGAYEDRKEDLSRTVFAVGDVKQSIYSFQRADPGEFLRMRDHFRAQALSVERNFRQVPLSHSFRSTSVVLAAVDAVFTHDEAPEGVTFGEDWRSHEAIRLGQAGLVEIWPPVRDAENLEERPWTLPTAGAGHRPARARLACVIAEKVSRWTQAAGSKAGDDSWLASQGRQVIPGDILVLVRRRNDFVEELVRELKIRDVPVAGIDRMTLTEQLAVMDLVALGHSLLLPEDDLMLATVLKSPLIGLNEEQLFEIAHDRKGSLWQSLASVAQEKSSCFSEAWKQIERWRSEGLSRPPFDFYSDLLAQGGRQKLLSRLGPDAADPLEEFLNLALAYEGEEASSLQGFLHWLAAGDTEVKRDLDSESQAVRIMTVHGAKGLQAPIVFLPDSMQIPQVQERLLWADDELPLWLPRSEAEEPETAKAKAADKKGMLEEYARLLYVALTRAEDRLYVCGWETKRKAPENCWYHKIVEGLADHCTAFAYDSTKENENEGWSGEGLRLAQEQNLEPNPAKARAVGSPEKSQSQLPDWAGRSGPRESDPPRPLTPTRPSGSEPAVRSPRVTQGQQGFQRGLLVHRLLQSLPDLPAERWEAAAKGFLAAKVHDLSPDQQEEIAGEVLSVLQRPEFRRLFGPNSRAEVPLAGLVSPASGPKISVSGQIDRLCVEEEKVLVLDYKTLRPAPKDLAGVPSGYLRQMAVYRQILSEIYHNRAIECYLLWTDDLHLMKLPDDLLSTSMS